MIKAGTPVLPRILVTSAAGKTGMPLTFQLLEQGYPVRAFVRRRHARADALAKAGAEIFEGDQYALSDMRRAMTGVQRAYQCAPTAPNGLHFNAVFTAAACEAELEHVVTLGQWLSAADHPSLFTREVYLSDILIRMSPRMSVTSVNPGWFADNYLMVLDMAAHLGVFTMPLGDGDTKKNAPPSNDDIASVAAAALIDPETHAGKTYRPTGPTLLSPNEIADAMGRALGRRVRYLHISERMMVKALKALPPPNYSEAAVTQLAIYADEYRRGTFAVNAPTEDVLRVGGREPEDFESIVRRTVAARPEFTRSLGRSLGAIGGFLKILATRPFDLKRAEDQRDHVRLALPTFAQDDPGWRDSHRPQPQKPAPVRGA
jgi:NAD(P)H dehydrogenase (quinone)